MISPKYSMLLFLLLTHSSYGKPVKFFEDSTAKQASPEIIAAVEKIAQAINFDKDYEVVEPTTADMQINA